MTGGAAPGVLSPETGTRLVEFARACRTAARAVSLYPGGHPAIAAALERLAQVTAAATAAGPFRVQITADTLLVDGAALPRADAGVAELADLLHRHLVGALTLNPGADAGSWRTLLLLLARTPESVRSDGGIRHLWSTAGGPSIEIAEIDYAEVLREKIGVAAAVEQIIAAALAGARLDLDESGMQLLLDIVQSPAKLQELVAQLERVGHEQGADAQAAAFLAIVQGLARWLADRDPPRLDAVLHQMGQVAGRLSAGAMLKLLEHRARAEGTVGAMNVAGSVIERMTDESISRFVAGSVLRDRGATERLAHAFQALAPEVSRQRRLLAGAAQEVAASAPGAEGFAELWQRVESMLTSYSDESYVSGQYARELSDARGRAVDVERTSDDPPERVMAWLGTVSDATLRALDLQLLLDLLRLETDPQRWRDIAETAAAHAEDLVRVGYFDRAWTLLGAIANEGRPASHQTYTRAVLQQFGRGTTLRHVATHLRTCDDDDAAAFATCCRLIGSAVVPPLVDVLAAEQDTRARARLRDVVLGFGPEGRDVVRPLMNADTWEVRRTAASLLRESGGSEGLREWVPLLSDAEPLVRREAAQALLLHGSEEASRLLLDAIATATASARALLVAEAAGVRDERAAPFLTYVLRQVPLRRMPDLYLAAVEALGTAGGPDAVPSLRRALYQGDWRMPFRTRRARRAAARALLRIGTADAEAALREAAASGRPGVRSAARPQLRRWG